MFKVWICFYFLFSRMCVCAFFSRMSSMQTRTFRNKKRNLTSFFDKSANCPIVYTQLDKLHRIYQLTFIVCSELLKSTTLICYCCLCVCICVYNTLPYEKLNNNENPVNWSAKHIQIFRNRWWKKNNNAK